MLRDDDPLAPSELCVAGRQLVTGVSTGDTRIAWNNAATGAVSETVDEGALGDYPGPSCRRDRLSLSSAELGGVLAQFGHRVPEPSLRRPRPRQAHTTA
jgi:hypothetical protein